MSDIKCPVCDGTGNPPQGGGPCKYCNGTGVPVYPDHTGRYHDDDPDGSKAARERRHEENSRTVITAAIFICIWAIGMFLAGVRDPISYMVMVVAMLFIAWLF